MVYTLDKASGETTPLISLENPRVDLNNVISNSFVLIPDYYAGQCPTDLFFISDRNYEIEGNYDLFLVDSLNKTEKLVEKGIASQNLFFKDGATYYFKDGSTTFGLYEYSEDGSVETKTFSGSANQYMFKDKYIFSPSTKILHNIWTGDNLGIQTTLSLTGMQDFAVSKDMKKITIVGTFSGSKDKIFCYNADETISNVIEGDEMFIPNASNITTLDSGILICAPSDNSDSVLNLVIPMDKLFAIKGS
ncbi:MAG: hypothetical protein PUD72_01765 [Oscillospiraceae bacterium]|nr:hypothetical protein [Oscillospiraceae bacterium]